MSSSNPQLKEEKAEIDFVNHGYLRWLEARRNWQGGSAKASKKKGKSQAPTGYKTKLPHPVSSVASTNISDSSLSSSSSSGSEDEDEDSEGYLSDDSLKQLNVPKIISCIRNGTPFEPRLKLRLAVEILDLIWADDPDFE